MTTQSFLVSILLLLLSIGLNNSVIAQPGLASRIYADSQGTVAISGYHPPTENLAKVIGELEALANQLESEVFDRPDYIDLNALKRITSQLCSLQEQLPRGGDAFGPLQRLCINFASSKTMVTLNRSLELTAARQNLERLKNNLVTVPASLVSEWKTIELYLGAAKSWVNIIPQEGQTTSAHQIFSVQTKYPWDRFVHLALQAKYDLPEEFHPLFKTINSDIKTTIDAITADQQTVSYLAEQWTAFRKGLQSDNGKTAQGAGIALLNEIKVASANPPEPMTIAQLVHAIANQEMTLTKDRVVPLIKAFLQEFDFAKNLLSSQRQTVLYRDFRFILNAIIVEANESNKQRAFSAAEVLFLYSFLSQANKLSPNLLNQALVALVDFFTGRFDINKQMEIVPLPLTEKAEINLLTAAFLTSNSVSMINPHTREHLLEQFLVKALPELVGFSGGETDVSKIECQGTMK